MTIEERQLTNIIAEAIQVGRLEQMVENKGDEAYISLHIAYKLYKRADVDAWIRRQLIQPKISATGKSISYSRVELAHLCLTQKRSYKN